MRKYDEMMMKFEQYLECESLSEAECILDSNLHYPVVGPEPKGTRVIPVIIKSNRKKAIIEECKKEIFHDGVNIFRVIVNSREDESSKYFPMQGENGSVNEFRY